jgi:hypothetical protein
MLNQFITMLLIQLNLLAVQAHFDQQQDFPLYSNLLLLKHSHQLNQPIIQVIDDQ